jgi:hypothetical protein
MTPIPSVVDGVGEGRGVQRQNPGTSHQHLPGGGMEGIEKRARRHAATEQFDGFPARVDC